MTDQKQRPKVTDEQLASTIAAAEGKQSSSSADMVKIQKSLDTTMANKQDDTAFAQFTQRTLEHTTKCQNAEPKEIKKVVKETGDDKQ